MFSLGRFPPLPRATRPRTTARASAGPPSRRSTSATPRASTTARILTRRPRFVPLGSSLARRFCWSSVVSCASGVYSACADCAVLARGRAPQGRWCAACMLAPCFAFPHAPAARANFQSRALTPSALAGFVGFSQIGTSTRTITTLLPCSGLTTSLRGMSGSLSCRGTALVILTSLCFAAAAFAPPRPRSF